MSSANVTCGLRDSSVYASERNVVISSVRVVPSGRAALGADRAEPLALRPHRLAPAAEQAP